MPLSDRQYYKEHLKKQEAQQKKGRGILGWFLLALVVLVIVAVLLSRT